VVRTTVIVILFCVFAGPVAGVICGLTCAVAHGPTHEFACHEHSSDHAATQVAALHVCDHNPADTPFLVEAQTSFAPSDVVTAALSMAVPAPKALAGESWGLTRVGAGGTSSALARTILLRI
jgi:hypothetical protein